MVSANLENSRKKSHSGKFMKNSGKIMRLQLRLNTSKICVLNTLEFMENSRKIEITNW